MTEQTVVIGMSGGVDSSVAAWLLKAQGYHVIGLFMKNWEDDDDEQSCSSRQDWLDAASVADLIGIDLEAVNFAAEYRKRVFSIFLREYAAGRTPNPDVLCNAEIKFSAFLDHALMLGAQKIATGHYASVRQTASGHFELLKAKDLTKDQSYFLHRLNQQQLARTIFPLGKLMKTKVREIAKQISLPNAKKKDSTGICFIGERPFRDFLRRYLPTQPGPIKMPDEQIIGEHMGLAFYTLGQRKGIGLGGSRDGSGQPWFVAAKDVSENALYVVQGRDHPWLTSSTLVADNASWIAGQAPQHPSNPSNPSISISSAKIRYRQADAPCIFSPQNNNQFALHFHHPQWAVTPGQSAVLYEGEVCMGGGTIATTAPQNRSRGRG